MFTNPRDPVDYVYNLFTTQPGNVGFASILKYDETTLPVYPCLLLVPDGLVRSYHATRTFELTITTGLYVYHADMTLSHQHRMEADLDLVQNAVDLLHSDFTAGGGFVYAFVSDETPGAFAGPKGQAVVGTRIRWTGNSQVRF